MIRFLSTVPIFRRLFIAFAVAAVIPGIVIILLGNFYVNSLNARSQAVSTSFDAQNLAAQEETNLQLMNQALNTQFNNVFASLSRVITDPSLYAYGVLDSGEIKQLEADFDRQLQVYESQYGLNSPNMSNVRSILVSDDPTGGNTIINSQQTALNNVAKVDWIGTSKTPGYKPFQDSVLRALQGLQNQLQKGQALTAAEVNAAYVNDYPTLFSANQA